MLAVQVTNLHAQLAKKVGVISGLEVGAWI
jgi:hypothetical protein